MELKALAAAFPSDIRSFTVMSSLLPDDPPIMPRDMPSRAEAKWVELIALLHPIGVVRLTDSAALEQYCRSYDNWRTAIEQIDATGGPVIDVEDYKGNVHPKTNPWCKERDAAFDRMDKIGQQLGLTPAARTRVPGHAEIKGKSTKTAEDAKRDEFKFTA